MIEFQNVGKDYGGVPVIDGLSLTVARGEFLVLIGASGSGKSTLLKMINRLVEHDRGRILFAGEEIRGFAPEQLRRRMGYAIQSTGLFPHWTVERNIACVPSLLKWPAQRIRDRVTELLGLLGLDAAQYRGRYPHQLSGGQQQRVGVARALAADPDVLLMDEPFGALDPLTRGALQQEMVRIHRASGKTIVLVTHDIDEALQLATRIVMLDHGRILQAGAPVDFLARPADARVAAFVGQADIGIRLLALRRVADAMRPGALPPAGGAVAEGLGEVADTASLREALSLFVTQRADVLAVVDAQQRRIGSLHLADLVGAAR